MDTPTAGAIIVNHFFVAFEDGAGHDLLGSGAFVLDSLEVRYVVDGEIVRGYGSKTDLVTRATRASFILFMAMRPIRLARSVSGSRLGLRNVDSTIE